MTEKRDFVPGLVDYEQDATSITINFEYADDYHITLSNVDWKRFCDTLPDQSPFPFFREHYSENSVDFTFEETLDSMGIKYFKISFWDPDD